MNPHLKLAYEYGLQQAIKEAGLLDLTARDLFTITPMVRGASKFPTFRKIFNVAPQMAHKSGMGAKGVRNIQNAMKGTPKAKPVLTAEQQAYRQAENARLQKHIANQKQLLQQQLQLA